MPYQYNAYSEPAPLRLGAFQLRLRDRSDAVAAQAAERSEGTIVDFLAQRLTRGLCASALFLGTAIVVITLASAGPANATSFGAMEWGSFEPPVPASGLSGITSVSAGGDNLALLSDGTVVEWNFLHDNQMPVAGLSQVVAISAGGSSYTGGPFNLALLRNGTVMAWGDNEYGELGDGTTEEHEGPVVVSGLSKVVAISAGEQFGLALLRNGTVKAWGNNESGQLGDGVFGGSGECECSTTPVTVSGLTKVTAIDTGGSHSGRQSQGGEHALALLENGTVKSWGSDEHGELGTGTRGEGPSEDEPVAVAGLSDVTAVSAGGLTSMALLSDGAVDSWGDNEWRELGYIGPLLSGSPHEVENLSEVAAISMGSENGMALLRNGTVMEWGAGAEYVGPGGGGFCEEESGGEGRPPPEFPCGKSAAQVSELSGVDGISASEEATSLVFGPLALLVTKVDPDTGAVGTVVTVTGTNFSGATAVDFGSNEATSFTVNSPTSITATAPAGAGTVDVRVITSEGASPVRPADRFGYVPQVESVTPDKGAAAGGTEVTISGSYFAEVTSVKFGATAASSFHVNSSTSITAVSPSGTGTVDITVTNATGTSTIKESDHFTYVPPPNASIETPASGGTYLQGAVVTTKFSCTEGEDGPGLESCTDSNGGSGTSGALETSALGAHTYTVTAKSKDGQTGTASISYTVVAQPTCTGDAGKVTLSPGLTDTAAVQTMKIKGTLTGCAGPPFTGATYTATLKTAGPVSCPVLRTAGEPAAGATKYRWTPKAKASTGTLSIPLTETPEVAFSGEVTSGSYAPLTLTGAATESFTGGATCGEKLGKKTVKAVKKGTFSGVISGFGH